jgi:cytochrome P450
MLIYRKKFFKSRFGGGARGCLGGRFGILEAKLILIILLKNVLITKNINCQKLDSILAFTLRPKNLILVDVTQKN